MIPVKMMQRQIPGSKVSFRHPACNHLETMVSRWSVLSRGLETMTVDRSTDLDRH